MASEGSPRRALATAIVVLALLAGLAVLGPRLFGDPEIPRLEEVLVAPSASHWMGTDGLGRDVAARLADGARVSLTVGFLTVAFVLAIGAPLGAIAGYAGGIADAVIRRVVDAWLAFPALVGALAVLGASPPWLARIPSALRIAIVLGGFGWPVATRYVRAEVLRIRGSDAVVAARAAGAGPWRIVLRHVLPAALTPTLVTAAFGVGGAILAESSLSFLGLGVAPPQASWGGLLAEARLHAGAAWWLALFPGGALFLTLLACNLLADGIRRRLSAAPEET